MDYFAGSALLPNGWQENVLIKTSAHGDIREVIPNAAPGTAAQLGDAVVPGIPNVHSHAHQRAIAGLTERRGGAADDDFWTWRELVYRSLDVLTPEDLQAIAAQAYLEMLSQGYTAVGEFHYLHHGRGGERYQARSEMGQRIAQAAEATGIGLTLLPVLYRYGGFGNQEPAPNQRRFVCELEEFVALYEELLALTEGNPNAALGVAPHSLRAVSPPLLEGLTKYLGGHAPAAPIHIHVSEQESEVDACVKLNGLRPVEWLFEHCPPDARFCLVHATHTTPSELAAIARSGAVVGVCPTTEADLGDGFFNALEFAALDGACGIGSDSNVCLDPAAELRLLEYGQRLQHRRRNLLARGPGSSTGRTLVERAFFGGARALGRRIGRIDVGCRADLVGLDTEHPALAARSEDALLDTWIFGSDAALVRHVVVGGRLVVHDRQHRERERIERDFKRTLSRLMAAV